MGCPLSWPLMWILEPNTQSLINSDSHLITTCTLGRITGKNILIQTQKVCPNGKLHMNQSHVAQEPRESITALKDTRILYRQMRVVRFALNYVSWE